MFAKYLSDDRPAPTLKQVYISPEVLLERLEELINTHFKEQKDPAFYACKLACGKRTLNDLCRKCLGKTVFMLVQERILIEAKYLVCKTSMPAKIIGYELGFCDPGHFSRFFKQMTGRTVREWRRELSSVRT